MDAPIETKDALPKGQPSEVKKEPSTPPKMISEEQAEKLANDRHSKLDTKISRLEKSLVTANERVTTVLAKEVERQRERDEAAIRDAAGDPIKLNALQTQKAFREEQATHKNAVAAFEKEKTDVQEKIDKIEAAELKDAIKVIAEEAKVNVKLLEDLGITDIKVITATAKAMANAKPFNPDSGEDIGGVGQTEQQRLDKLYPTTAKKS